jgi:quercetin dioxygenase-like cupin family protein
MRLLIAGSGANGRSRLLETTSKEELAGLLRPSGSVTAMLFETTESPPPAGSAGCAPALDLSLAPGCARWFRVTFPACAASPVHRTDTIDLGTIVSGSIDIILDDGSHRLEAGDSIAVTGAAHGWNAGPDGCTMSVVMLGTLPPDSAGEKL